MLTSLNPQLALLVSSLYISRHCQVTLDFFGFNHLIVLCLLSVNNSIVFKMHVSNSYKTYYKLLVLLYNHILNFEFYCLLIWFLLSLPIHNELLCWLLIRGLYLYM